ncbi:shikimate kinase [Desulfolithobacter dissulfuricans]|uniref:Shikimate kinase n=1 Tax=Desulfolithobacter dissulfuricans TaxID=2795293 RepID=A0A915UA57_9BACT|nr:shikimate kinase [Desulfolithobacter dissulfuricans]BCO09170.1 shikimate kinase [Desulfolithobacter dissulfuricans]
MADNIILIGFMGVGKGRTARELARRTGFVTVDTDDLIETMVKKKIRRIFAEEGEARFRELEKQVARWLEHHVQQTIVSTGGGFFMVGNLQRLGRVFYLHSSVEGILDAISMHPKAKKKIKKRPLLQDLDRARELYCQRLPLYRRAADREINVEGRTIDEVAAEIASCL